MERSNEVRVWDLLVRLFHWTLVAAFFTAYLTAGEPAWLHTYAGYLILILLAVRIVWGFVGSEHARFKDFIYAPPTILHYLKDEVLGRARRYLGHNPVGGAMILLLFFALIATAFSGMALLAAEAGQGPLAGWLIAAPPAALAGGHETPLAHNIEEVHEFFANFTLALVFLHVLGVIVESLRHHENLIKAMLTGYKRL